MVRVASQDRSRFEDYPPGSSICRHADAVLVYYNVDDEDGLDQLDGWLEEGQRFAREMTPFILVGCKWSSTAKCFVSADDVQARVGGDNVVGSFEVCTDTLDDDANELFIFAVNAVLERRGLQDELP